MTKFTLLAAASAAAMIAAGAAQAGTMTGTINTNATTATAPYTIAAERTNAADISNASTFTNTLAASAQPSFVTGAADQVYSVVFDITGGTIATGNTAALSIVATGAGGTAATATVAQGARSATSIQFIVTVSAPVTAASTSVLQGFTLTAKINNSTAESDISVGGSVSLLAGGVTTAIDTTAPTKLVRYVNALGAFSTTPKAVFAALPDFKQFTLTSGGATANAAVLADAYTVAATSNATNAQTVFYNGLSAAGDGAAVATAVTAGDILNGAKLDITGGSQLNTLVPSVPVSAGTSTPTLTASVASFALENTAGDTLLSTVAEANRPDFVLTEPATTIVIQPASFTTAYTPTYAVGYTAPGAASVASGSVSLDGVNFIAPWVGGPQAPGQTVIRLSNGSATPSGTVTLRLINAQARAAGVTTGPGAKIADQVCSTAFAVQANGEMQITGATLAGCFGQFLRGDLQITVQSSATNLTAKARNVAADGTVFEQTLGRFSGSAAAGAAF